MFSYRISDPLRFYKLLAGNVSGRYDRSKLNGQIAAQLGKLLGPALNTLCIRGIRPSEIPAHTEEVSREVRAASAKGWLEEHGLELVSVAVSSLTPTGGDRDALRTLQASGVIAGRYAPAEPEGEPSGERPPEPAPEAQEKPRERWTCLCGQENTGNFCWECGRPRKWTCSCGAENTGKFCTECGSKRPE